MVPRLNIAIFILLLSSFVLSNPSTKRPRNSLSESSLATLQFVAVVSRHGSRTPLHTFPNDPYPYSNKLFWPTGPDELTYYGKQQLYETGEKLRRRYGDFLPQLFYPNDTVAEYNNINRDFMSAACLLAALYPPVGDAVWQPGLSWQPIPQSVRPFDVCDLPYETKCPLFKKESDRLLQELNEQSLNDSTTVDVLRQVSLHTGAKITKVTDLFDIYDILTMQSQNGFKLPSWTESLFPEPMRTVAAPVLVTNYAGSETLIKLAAGPELKYISEMLNMKANGTFEKNRKFYVEAAHDCTLIALRNAMGYNDLTFEVKTSAYMTFELHYLMGTHIVEVLYYENSNDDEPELLNIEGCPNPCSLDSFSEFVDKVNPPDWDQECLSGVHLNYSVNA